MTMATGSNKPDQTSKGKTPEPSPVATAPEASPEIKDIAISAKVENSAIDKFRPTSDGTAAALPRIVLLQSLSKEVTAEEESQRKPVGTYFNRLTKEGLGKQLDVIVMGHFPQRLLLRVGEGLKCRSVNMFSAQMMGGRTASGQPTDQCTTCVLREWPRERIARGEVLDAAIATKGPECSVVDNFPALFMPEGGSPDDYELTLLSFSKTSAPAAKDLLGLYQISNKPWWAFVYRVTSVRDPRGPNGAVFYRSSITRVGRTTEVQQAKVQEWMTFLSRTSIESTIEPEDEGATADSGEPVDLSKTAF
jgi:hypothetical protein